MQIAPHPRVAKPYVRDRQVGALFSDQLLAYADVYQVPVSGMAVVGAVLTHRGLSSDGDQ